MNIAGPLLLVAVVVLGGAGVYLYQSQGPVAGSPEANAAQVAATVSAVGKLIVLPEGETPTVAEVTSTDALKDQPFFQKAKIGDQVLIYPNARRAYLYDPKANKVLEVAPVSFDEPAPAPAQEAAADTSAE